MKIESSMDFNCHRRHCPHFSPSFPVPVSCLNWQFIRCLSTLVLLLFIGLPSSSAAHSTFLSGYLFGAQPLTGRNLLQARKPCPINFEFQNYTIITSRCKGPRYPPNLCCAAFKEFACPYAEELNDLKNDCASTMFSYINLYGKYPPGLFASECREGKEGLECSALSPSQLAEQNASARVLYAATPFLMLVAGIVVLFLQLF